MKLTSEYRKLLAELSDKVRVDSRTQDWRSRRDDVRLDASQVKATATRLLDVFPSIPSFSDVRIDADFALFAARELEILLTDHYEEEFPNLPVAEGEILDIDTSSVPAGADTWTYFMYSHTAIARLGSDFSGSTLPLVTLKGSEVNRRVESIENGYQITTKDMRRAGLTGMPLERKLGIACLQGHQQMAHRLGLWGRTDLQIHGLLNHPNITYVAAPAPIFGSADPADDATVDQILTMFGTLIETAADLSNGLRETTRVLVSRRVRKHLMTKLVGDGAGTITVWQLLVNNWSGEADKGHKVEFMVLEELDYSKAVTEAARAPEFASHIDINSTTGDVAIAYIHNRPDLARFIQPMPFTQHPVQARDLNFNVPCESEWGGLRLDEPMSVVRMEGLHL